jgi:hypothetical protein
MLAAFLLLAAEVAGAAEEAEPSKAPFYVAGGLFAVFAVVLGVVGLRSPDFPRTGSAARGVMTVSVVLMVAAMATAVVTA